MKILVTGGSGLVGRSLKKYLPDATYLSSKDCNLTSETEVSRLFNQIKPDVVIHLAAKVGGIVDNINKPAEYFDDNVLMNTLVVRASHQHGVKRLIGVLSTCIYPDTVKEYPMYENSLHLGPPTETNFSYGYAKRSLAVQIEAYNKQYGTQYQYLIPCNLYGEFDKFGDNSHFVAALIKKIHKAKLNNEVVELFGDGSPLRQFMHANDFAYIIDYCLKHNIYDNMNVATNENLTIHEMAKIALHACDANELSIVYDSSKPNGQYRKDVSIGLLMDKIPSFKPTKLEDGIRETYQYLLKNNIL